MQSYVKLVIITVYAYHREPTLSTVSEARLLIHKRTGGLYRIYKQIAEMTDRQIRRGRNG